MSRARKRSAVLGRWKVSFSLEATFWLALNEIAERRKWSRARLIREINATLAPHQQLSSAIRVFVLEETQEQVREGQKYAGELRDTIKELILGIEDPFERTAEGHAPIAVIIAGARNAA